jgi:hypothetical protein
LSYFLGKPPKDYPESRVGRANSTYIDNWPWIFKSMENNGYLEVVCLYDNESIYVTMFNEDEPHIAAFNFRLVGFRNQPTDHYMRTLMVAKQRKPDEGSCIWVHETQLSWTKEFLASYKESPKFAMFFNKIGHDQPKALGKADEDLQLFLEGIYNDGTLDNSMVFIFGDHGSRFGLIREVLQVSTVACTS